MLGSSSWSKPFPPNQHLHFSPLRRLQSATDSDGTAYSILVQTEEMSCGVAAAAMIMDLIIGHAQPAGPDAEQRLKQIAAQFLGSLVESDRRWSTGHDYGSTVANIAMLLKHQNVAVSSVETRTAKAPLVVQLSRLGKPAALLWGWYPSGITGKRTGGHFTVGAAMTSRAGIVILDPWDGSLSEILPAATYQKIGLLDCATYTG